MLMKNEIGKKTHNKFSLINNFTLKNIGIKARQLLHKLHSWL